MNITKHKTLSSTKHTQTNKHTNTWAKKSTTTLSLTLLTTSFTDGEHILMDTTQTLNTRVITSLGFKHHCIYFSTLLLKSMVFHYKGYDT